MEENNVLSALLKNDMEFLWLSLLRGAPAGHRNSSEKGLKQKKREIFILK